MTSDNDTVQITAQCLCKTHTFTTTVPRTSLPLQATACHCNSCRHVTGAMYSMDVSWPGDPQAIRQSTLKKYDFSERIKVLFCGTCSCPLFFEMPPPHNDDAAAAAAAAASERRRIFGVFTGALSNEGPRDLVRLDNHMYVGDTLDGGATTWMHGGGWGLSNPDAHGVMEKTKVRRFLGRRYTSEELGEDWPPGPDGAIPVVVGGGGADRPKTAATTTTQEVPIRCHCGGIDLLFLQGKAEHEFTAAEGLDELLPRGVVDPVTRKYVAGFDVCDSCRMSSGSDFVNWTFSFLRHIGFPSPPPPPVVVAQGQGSQSSRAQHLPGFPSTVDDLYTAVSVRAREEDRDPRLGTLAVYCSSEGVKRYFCSRCSACVFYATDARHDLVNLAVGLLEAVDGARAEGTLRWLLGGPILHRDDMVGGWREDWLKTVEAESESLRVARKFPKWWL